MRSSARESSTPPIHHPLALQARAASRDLALIERGRKDAWLQKLIDHLIQQESVVLASNKQDVAAAMSAGQSPAFIDRLTLNRARLIDIRNSLCNLISLSDPVGEVISTTTRPNGLLVQKIRVPLGVLFFIYESRPNVTIDAAALAIKSGNAIILRGGKEAAHSNAALMECIALACRDAGLPEHAVQLVTDPDRTIVTRLLKEEKHIDLVIPRGGEGLIRTVVAESHVPVLKHYQGICHLYVDRQADPHIAVDILINGKCQRPGVCNALETLLVHEGIAPDFFSLAAPALAEQQVEVRGCPRTLQLLPRARLATDMDYATEYLALILSCKVVRNIDEAITHIQRYSSGHSEAIITNNEATAKRFTSEIDSAALFVNASTRFHDGYELGLGAEIGISTDKMHARGPCGLVELTSYKYVIVGSGHVRS